MTEVESNNSVNIGWSQVFDILFYLKKKWRFLLLATILGAVIGYFKIRTEQPIYTANYSFVLSTDQKNNNGLVGLASQIGFDGLTSSPDNIFSGDNIIELFKSRKLIGNALQSMDSISHQTLLNYIVQKEYSKIYNKIGPFNQNPETYTPIQKSLYGRIKSKVGESFIVFKKDKKLIFYIISAKSTDPKIAYYEAKYMLNQTSKYFIETKTKVAASSVKLLQHEADSLAQILSKTFISTASVLDRTYNLNPSITIQRSGSLFNQAKVNAFGAAYTEVMRNLEIAKVNLQKETPLFRIIDEPEFPLPSAKVNKLLHIILTSAIGLLTMASLFLADRLYKILY